MSLMTPEFSQIDQSRTPGPLQACPDVSLGNREGAIAKDVLAVLAMLHALNLKADAQWLRNKLLLDMTPCRRCQASDQEQLIMSVAYLHCHCLLLPQSAEGMLLRDCLPSSTCKGMVRHSA